MEFNSKSELFGQTNAKKTMQLRLRTYTCIDMFQFYFSLKGLNVIYIYIYIYKHSRGVTGTNTVSFLSFLCFIHICVEQGCNHLAPAGIQSRCWYAVFSSDIWFELSLRFWFHHGSSDQAGGGRSSGTCREWWAGSRIEQAPCHSREAWTSCAAEDSAKLGGHSHVEPWWHRPEHYRCGRLDSSHLGNRMGRIHDQSHLCGGVKYRHRDSEVQRDHFWSIRRTSSPHGCMQVCISELQSHKCSIAVFGWWLHWCGRCAWWHHGWWQVQHGDLGSQGPILWTRAGRDWSGGSSMSRFAGNSHLWHKSFSQPPTPLATWRRVRARFNWWERWRTW